MTSGDHPCQPLTVGRSHQSPPTQEVAPVQPHSPRLHPQDHDDQTILDEQYVKVGLDKTASYSKVRTGMGVACCYGNDSV